MKQHTTPEQTAKLIELGFEPELKIRVAQVTLSKVNIDHDCNFSIGDLIEMLGYDSYDIHYSGFSWEVKRERECLISDNLIDALYDMIVKLKEEGAI